MRYLIVIFFLFLLNGCGLKCWDYKSEFGKGFSFSGLNLVKKITIKNHTNKTYTNNVLCNVDPIKNKWIWKLYSTPYDFQKISIIKPNKEINKNEKGEVLKLDNTSKE